MSKAPGEETRHLRVALIGCTGLLGDIIGRAVAGEPDIDVVELNTPTAVGQLPTVDADLVIWNDADEARLEQELAYLSAQCGGRVLATLGDGREASLWRLAPHRTELGALSPAALVATIRASAQGTGGS